MRRESIEKRWIEDLDTVHIKDGPESTEGGSEWRGRLDDVRQHDYNPGNDPPRLAAQSPD